MRFPRNYLEKISFLDSVYIPNSRSASLCTGSSSVICSNLVPLGSATTQAVLNGVVVYEVCASWDYGAGGQGTAAYLVQIEGD